MISDKQILLLIRNKVKSVDPTAKVILYGSFARGENKPDSDIDLLILVDKYQLSLKDKKDIKYPLYDIEFQTGRIISPLVLSSFEWESKHKITPFYYNIKKEGIEL
jgi:predicted nucleotidyltransferase